MTEDLLYGPVMTEDLLYGPLMTEDLLYGPVTTDDLLYGLVMTEDLLYGPVKRAFYMDLLRGPSIWTCYDRGPSLRWTRYRPVFCSSVFPSPASSSSVSVSSSPSDWTGSAHSMSINSLAASSTLILLLCST